MQALEVDENELVLCPMRAEAQADEERYVSADFCVGCKNFGGEIRGGGGASGMAVIGENPTKINCKYE